MDELFKKLPDDRPITSICIVENVDKCPKGFSVVSRTHDQDSDADLWREGGFFGRKCTRYICISKTEGSTGRVIQALVLIGEKEQAPDGYSIIPKTIDSLQKASRKKRLCYKSGHAGSTCSAVTDIIVLSRMKEPPEEFILCGEINGVTLCYKMGKSSQPPAFIPYSLGPVSSPSYPTQPCVDYENTPPRGPGTPNQSQHDYEVLRRAPALPPPMVTTPPNTYATISGFTGLDGVPFELNPALSLASKTSPIQLSFKPKTSAQIDEEFNYNFRTERET